MLARATKERTPLELRPLDRAQKLQGRDVSNKANAANPKTRTGSEVIDSRSKLPKADDDASSCKGNSALKDQRLACLNRKPPPANEINTGDQAARRGGNVPFTPRELKLKLST